MILLNLKKNLINGKIGFLKYQLVAIMKKSPVERSMILMEDLKLIDILRTGELNLP